MNRNDLVLTKKEIDDVNNDLWEGRSLVEPLPYNTIELAMSYAQIEKIRTWLKSVAPKPYFWEGFWQDVEQTFELDKD